MHTQTHSGCESDSARRAPDVVSALKSPEELPASKPRLGSRGVLVNGLELKQLGINHGSEDLEKATEFSSRIIDGEVLVLIRRVDFGQLASRRARESADSSNMTMIMF